MPGTKRKRVNPPTFICRALPGQKWLGQPVKKQVSMGGAAPLQGSVFDLALGAFGLSTY